MCNPVLFEPSIFLAGIPSDISEYTGHDWIVQGKQAAVGACIIVSPLVVVFESKIKIHWDSILAAIFVG